MDTRPLVPRAALLTVFTVMVVAVAGAFFGHASRAGAGLPASALVAERDLRFVDLPDGGVGVMSGRDGREIAAFHGEQGFLRGTLRGFARTRQLADLGPTQPLHLARWADGRLTLDDPLTGQHVELLAFGPTNAGVFAPLLDTK